MKFKNRVTLIVTVLLLVICGVTAYNLWPKTGKSPTLHIVVEEHHDRTGMIREGGGTVHSPGFEQFMPSRP